MAPIEDYRPEDFDRTVALNVRAAFVAGQAAAKHMPSGARIITIGSCNAERMPFTGGAVYTMSKAALAGLVKGLARDLGPRGITVNNIQPGPIDTDMNPATANLPACCANSWPCRVTAPSTKLQDLLLVWSDPKRALSPARA